MQIKNILALSIVGLYVFVTLILLFWNMTSQSGYIGMFFDQMSKANFY